MSACESLRKELTDESTTETADMLSSSYSKAFRLSAKQEQDVARIAGN